MTETSKITESVLEEAALAWFEALDYEIANGPLVAPGELLALRKDYSEVVLKEKLADSLAQINPKADKETIEEAVRKVLLTESPSLTVNNRNFHRKLVEGVPVEIKREDGTPGHEIIKLVDFENTEANSFLVINQFSVAEGHNVRRPDIVVFVNGLPLAVVELKNPADEDATIDKAISQLQTYKDQIPSLFTCNEILAVSDGINARIGSLTANKEWFLPWRTIEGEKKASAGELELEVLIKGVFDKRRFLDYIRSSIVFEDFGDEGVIKKIAGYHQYHAVNKAVEATVKASSVRGDKRCGVIWHTQGSGKSLTMVFYAGKIVQHPAMENPTIVLLTDRNDLDDQLFGTFSRCAEILRQKPVQAETRAKLRQLLDVASGGVVFTTIQKFLPFEDEDKHPQLSSRRNIVVIADEAHRSQYDFIDGYARYMREALPNASFIGFTGTPLEKEDRNTRHVFGDHISIYDIQQAVTDGATVPIYYESRLAKIELNEEETPHLDEDFDEATEYEEVKQKEKLKTKWAALEALVGTEKRIKLIAEDIVYHFQQRLEVMDGKAMIVCMSRRICVELYNAITRLKPQWHDEDDKKGQIKIVMTGSASDPQNWQQHIRNKQKREFLAKRFKDPKESFKMVIVRDMWLTGCDVPCLHTMYIDKPMRGHTLMQAIARVNRVFKDKPGGLVVDYLGLAAELKYAMRVYTESGGEGKTALLQEEAVEIMLEKCEICRQMFHKFDYSIWKTGPDRDRLSLLPAAREHILTLEDGKNRFMDAVLQLSKAFALAVPNEKALKIRDDVAFFQAVKAGLVKIITEGGKKKSIEEIEQAIKQIISKAVAPAGVIDIFAAAGLQKPDISILSEEFLAEVRNMPYKNLAVELLHKLLSDEIKTRSRKNLVLSRSFKEMLEKTIRAYQNRTIEAAAVIEALIDLAKKMRAASERGEDLGLSEDELAFYDALEVNDSAVKVLGDKTLKIIAQELVGMVRKNVTIDWTVRETVRAKLRVMVKRILNKYGYPPDKQESATNTVLQQAELLCQDWAV
jgi:type I restriction enzyme R subunit